MVLGSVLGVSSGGDRTNVAGLAPFLASGREPFRPNAESVAIGANNSGRAGYLHRAAGRGDCLSRSAVLIFAKEHRFDGYGAIGHRDVCRRSSVPESRGLGVYGGPDTLEPRAYIGPSENQIRSSVHSNTYIQQCDCLSSHSGKQGPVNSQQPKMAIIKVVGVLIWMLSMKLEI